MDISMLSAFRDCQTSIPGVQVLKLRLTLIRNTCLPFLLLSQVLCAFEDLEELHVKWSRHEARDSNQFLNFAATGTSETLLGHVKPLLKNAPRLRVLHFSKPYEFKSFGTLEDMKQTFLIAAEATHQDRLLKGTLKVTLPVDGVSQSFCVRTAILK
jgi:hypothetical protein